MIQSHKRAWIDATGSLERKRMKSEFAAMFSSSDQQAVREGILFPLTEVDAAYAAGPISHVTTSLLEQLGYLAPNAFGGRTIDPEVDAFFSAALEIFNKSEQTEPGDYPYVGEIESPTGTHTVWISPNGTPGKHTLYLPGDT
jgi:hypothetical protein